MKRFTIIALFLLLTVCFQACSETQGEQPNTTIESNSELTTKIRQQELEEAQGEQPNTTIESNSELTTKSRQQELEEALVFKPPEWEARFLQSEGFSEQILSNPIDVAEYKLNNTDTFLLYKKFAEYWKIELDHILEKLYTYLNEENDLVLKNDQRQWEDYLNSSIALNEIIFIESNENKRLEGFDEYALDITRRYEIRKRTLELMEYYYRFTGEVSFVFTGVREEDLHYFYR